MKKRNINLDLIRVVAIFSVISIHFIRNVGFYVTSISGVGLSLAVFFRTLFMICVPLFLLLTGYLMNKKQLTKKYYISIFRIIFIFLAAKLTYILVEHFYFHELNSVGEVIRRIFNYSNMYADDYCWYVNMYFGLFLIIPFLNLIYNNLTTKKQKQILILTFFFLTSISSLNIKQITLIPDWWGGIYPITYYFIGAYICEYGFNLKKINTTLYLLTITLLSSIFYYIISYDGEFVARQFNDYRGPLTIITSVLVFGLLLKLDFSKESEKTKKILIKISEVSFGMYLFSFIVDRVIYEQINLVIYDINERLILFVLVIPLICILSFLLSLFFTNIYNKIIHPKITQKLCRE